MCLNYCYSSGPLAEIPEVEEEEQWQEELRLSSSEEISTPINDSRPDTRDLCISRARELSGNSIAYTCRALLVAYMYGNSPCIMHYVKPTVYISGV